MGEAQGKHEHRGKTVTKNQTFHSIKLILFLTNFRFIGIQEWKLRRGIASRRSFRVWLMGGLGLAL